MSQLLNVKDDPLLVADGGGSALSSGWWMYSLEVLATSCILQNSYQLNKK